MKRFIDMEQSTLSMLCFYQLGVLLSHTANECFIYHFCIMIKDFSISFSRVIIIVQDFETVTFYELFVNKPTFYDIFC